MTNSSRAGSTAGSRAVSSIVAQPDRPAAPSAATLPRNSRRLVMSASLSAAQVVVVLLDAAHPPVAVALEQLADIAALRLLEVVLDGQRADAVARQIQALQCFQLRALDVDAHVVDEGRCPGLRQNLGEGARLDLDDRVSLYVALPGTQVLLDSAEAAGLAEAHALAARAVDRIGEHGAAPARHVRRERVHADAFPSQVLENFAVGVDH